MPRLTAKFSLVTTLILGAYIFIRISDEPTEKENTAAGEAHVVNNMQKPTTNGHKHAFEPDHIHGNSGGRKKLIILLAYLRGGSSLFGRLFNMNRNVFYWYEPMSDIYNSFSMAKLMTLTLQVLYNRNGQPRLLTDIEKEYIHNQIFKMFTCDYIDAPTELLSSWTSMESPGMGGYRKCFLSLMEKLKPKEFDFLLVSPSEQFCQRKWHGVCSPYIGESMANSCHVFMNTTRSFLLGDKSHELPNPAEAPVIYEYIKCMQPITRATFKCLHHLKSYCQKSRIKATKIARMRLEDLQIFLDSQSFRDRFDIYVFHVLRDPRGIVASRRKDHRLTTDVGEEARLLCHKMLEDIRAREELSLKHNGTFLQVKYEELADDPVRVSHLIYAHIKEQLPSEVARWLRDNTHSARDGGPFSESRRNSSATARAWEKSLNDEDKLKITYPCRELLEKAGYQ